MPRQIRIEYEGAMYHVMSRGDRREDIVRNDAERSRFIETLGEAAGKCGWEIHAWCLMRNHFHLVVETPLGNLVAGMHWLLGTYSVRFNLRRQVVGHLFAGRYKSLLIDDGDPMYLATVCDYVHLNPARAGLVSSEGRLEDYRWSSYPAYLGRSEYRPSWLRVDRLLAEHGIRADNRQGRLQLSAQMEARRREGTGDEEQQYDEIRQGWRFGSKEFIARMLDRIEEWRGAAELPPSGGRMVAESMEQRAGRLILEELEGAGWDEERLTRERKGDPVKVRIARRLRAETTMTLQWIADRLSMGAWTYVSNLLRAANEAASAPRPRRTRRSG
jgi:putative transposase